MTGTNKLCEQLQQATDELADAIRNMPTQLTDLSDVEDVRKAVTEIGQIYIQFHRLLPAAPWDSRMNSITSGLSIQTAHNASAITATTCSSVIPSSSFHTS